jgi:hypothetical protein
MRGYLDTGDAKSAVTRLQQDFAVATADLEQVRVFRPDKAGERSDVQGSRGSFHFRSPRGRFVMPFPEEVAIAVNGLQNGIVGLRVQKFQSAFRAGT